MNPISLSLVASQFTLIWLLLTPVRGLWPDNVIGFSGFAMIFLGAVLALWAVYSLRLNNLSVLPEPVKNGMLVERGPYQYVRHPMYSALIVSGMGAVIAHGSLSKAMFLCALIGVLWVKIKREEKLLTDAYPGYKQYRERSSALVPGLL